MTRQASFLNQFRYYAEHNPKTSTALLTFGTVLSCGKMRILISMIINLPKSHVSLLLQMKTVAIVGFIELKDRIEYMKKGDRAASDSTNLSLEEAQLTSMLENAKNSTWQEHLRNASDAQDRFMLPNEDGIGTPEYVKKINDRSKEILRDEERRREVAKDFSSSRFWK